MKRGYVRLRLLVWAGIALTAAAGGRLLAQGAPPTPAANPQGATTQPAPPLPPPINLTDDPNLKSFVWRSIGPANMGGRIDDIAVDESNPSTFYIGLAGGGLWKTTNNGTTWTPIFDEYPVSSIGDIALAPSNANILYVGTGEPNNRQSSTFGGGIYKSTDGGKKFEYVGLKESQSIARVVVHPKDPNIVYVAAVGHLFGPNKERGLYKTTDGGKTWTNTKFIDEDTGFTDVVMDPSNPNVLLAASYQRRRQAWGFNGGGKGSGLWKTTDAGKSWTKLNGSGLPSNDIIGRIGMDVARSKPSTIYASFEVGASGGTGAGVNADGTLTDPNAGRGGGGGGGGRGQNLPDPPPNPAESGVWRSDDSGKTWRIVSNRGDRWMYYSQVRVDPTNPEIAYQGGAPFFKTIDGGKTWNPVQGIPHSDHHAIWIDPKNNKHLLLGNDGGLDVTYDQGETWEFVNTLPLGQFYAISADMRKPYIVCGGLQDNGSWCGPSSTRAGNILNSDWFRVGGGDGFYTANDPTDWTILYSESQDGATNRVDLRAGRPASIRPSGPRGQGAGRGQGQGAGRGAGAPAGGATGATGAPAATGAAGAPVGAGAPAPAGAGAPVTAAADPEAAGAAAQQQALAAQFGFGGNPRGNVVPTPAPGTNFRFFWSTPFILSPHNPRTIYLGAERLFRSYDRGDTWTASSDLTRNIGRNDRPIMGVDGKAPMASKHDGAASYSNIVTISESYVVPGILWVGTNDGNVQVSRDGGATWKNVIEKISGAPKEGHISRVEAGHFDAGTAFVAIDNHRFDDHKAYVYKTTDFGETWTSIAGNLPEGHVNVIRQDPKNANLLYLGSEYAMYISLNGGKDWKRFMNGLPHVRIDDIMVHPRDNDLIIGTHGRSIWILDDITALQQMTDQTTAADAVLMDIRPAIAWAQDIQKTITAEGAKVWRGQKAPAGTAISYWLKAPAAADVKIVISDVSGREVRSMEGSKDAGLQRVQWNLGLNTPAGRGGRGAGGGGGGGGRGGFVVPVPAGTYLVKLMIGDKIAGTKTVTVEADTTFMQ
ncbi:MAG: hypothetical protein ABIS06_17145 [Vicinamibacterales bacterium]